MNIGDNIRNVRRQKGMTLQQLADILGCSIQNVSQYENGRRKPKYDTIRKIIHALDVPLFDIVSEDELETIVRAQGREEVRQEIMQEGGRIIPKGEMDLVHNYNKLNNSGKQEARKRVEELTEIPRYAKKEDKPPGKK